MLRTAIIIGFDYSNLRLTYLPGIPIDLYSIYQTVKKSHPDKVIIITDIKQDYEGISLSDAIIDEIVDSDVTSFIKNIKEEKIHSLFTNLADLRRTLGEYSTGCNQLFFYYTGHAKDGNFLLPNGEFIKTSEVRDIFRENTLPEADIFSVIDCCYANGFSLPYRLVPHRGTYRYRLSQDVPEFPSQRILCFSSSTTEEKSVATRRGSIFTRDFCKILQGRSRNIPEILTRISDGSIKSYQQTVTVYSSYPNTSFLWGWLYGRNSDVNLSSIDCSIRIRRYSGNVCGDPNE